LEVRKRILGLKLLVWRIANHIANNLDPIQRSWLNIQTGNFSGHLYIADSGNDRIAEWKKIVTNKNIFQNIFENIQDSFMRYLQWKENDLPNNLKKHVVIHSTGLSLATNHNGE
jgi:hypothetical protein